MEPLSWRGANRCVRVAFRIYVCTCHDAQAELELLIFALKLRQVRRKAYAPYEARAGSGLMANDCLGIPADATTETAWIMRGSR